MPLTKVTKSGITNNAIDADKLEDGTILAADITPGTITADKLDSTLNLSSKTVTLPNTSVTNAMLAGSIANAKLANSSLTINGSSVSLGSSISAGALDWQAVITADGSTTTTGVAGRGYFINTTNAAHTFTLPSSPTIGDTIAIVDYAGTFATYNLTIARNGNNIQGAANNSQIGTNRASVTLVYVDATRGWVYQNESNVADLQEAIFITATGGTVTTDGNFKIHTFTGDGSFVVSQVGNPAGSGSIVDYLVVAGGGSGSSPGPGSPGPAAGGAGGFRFYANTTNNPQTGPGAPRNNYPSGAAVSVSATTYPITVGAGGTVASGSVGVSGSPSVFSTITSAGGGGGGNQSFPTPAFPDPKVGQPGGSGGGAAYPNSAAGTGNTPPVSPPQGSNGGSSLGDCSSSTGAGGGGAMAAANPTNTGGSPRGSEGGAGAGITGFGTSGEPSGGQYYFAGGGGAGGYATTPNVGGIGGGGDSAVFPSGANGGNGDANTGGGGGNANNNSPASNKVGGTGGKGIVVIRYKFQ